jgi:ribosomal protein L34
LAAHVRETVDGIRADHVHEVPERIDRQRRVGIRERSVPALGRDVVTRRAASATMAPRYPMYGDLVRGLERRHVSPDAGRGQREALGELGRGDRAVDDDEAKDLLTRRGLDVIHRRVGRGRKGERGAHRCSLRPARRTSPDGSR